MTNEELMVPRFKQLALYPECERHGYRRVGDIWTDDNKKPVTNQLGEVAMPLRWEVFPELFKPLQWWENRRPEDLPEYVKDDNGAYMVKEWHLELASKVTVFIIDGVHDGYVENAGECPLYSEFLPATIQQYIKYIMTKKNNG